MIQDDRSVPVVWNNMSYNTPYCRGNMVDELYVIEVPFVNIIALKFFRNNI